MKTLRFIGMALLAVALSVNFTACSDDDGDDDSGSITNSDEDGDDGSSSDSSSGKKLSAIVWDSYTDSLIYDKQGRLTEVHSTSPVEQVIITFEYENDSIIYTDDDGKRSVYTLNSDGNIVKSVDYDYGIAYATAQYTYDANKQLTNILRITEYNDPVQTELTWSNGCIAHVIYNDGAYTTYTYNSTLSSKGWIVFDDYFGIDVFSPYHTCWLANAGYFGKLPAYLISEIHSVYKSGYENSCQITYEYDDGYVSKMTNSRASSATLSWE